MALSHFAWRNRKLSQIFNLNVFSFIFYFFYFKYFQRKTVFRKKNCTKAICFDENNARKIVRKPYVLMKIMPLSNYSVFLMLIIAHLEIDGKKKKNGEMCTCKLIYFARPIIYVKLI